MNTSFKQFRLYKGFFFTGSLYNSQRPENFMLYNLEGTALLDEITSHIYIKDTRDIGALGSVGPSLVFVSIYHQDKRIERKLSLEVYDLRTQKIDTWMINRVSKFKIMNSKNRQSWSTFEEKKHTNVSTYTTIKSSAILSWEER